MASLVANSLAVPPPRHALDGTGALRELTNGPLASASPWAARPLPTAAALLLV